MEDLYDDGLVHSHGWVTQPPAHLAASAVVTADDADHDDGLVHDHGWACRERGTMANPA